MNHRRWQRFAGVWLVVALALATLATLPAQAAVRSVSPPEGPGGTRFHFTADGFEPGERVDSWISNPSGETIPRYPSVEADATGTAVWSWDAPAGATPGVWTSAARGIRSDLRVAINFKVTPSSAPAGPPQSVTPTTGGPGTIFTFTVGGFKAGERIGAWLVQPDGKSRELVPGEVFWRFADPGGQLSWTWQAPQDVAPGMWLSVARGMESNREVKISFTVMGSNAVAPIRNINPTSGAPGTTFSISADGFEPNEQVGTWFNRPDGSRFESTSQWLFADQNGAVAWQWTAPADAAGGRWQAVMRGTNTNLMVALDFTITGNNPVPPGPTVTGTVEPASGTLETTFNFTTQGFFADEIVSYWTIDPNRIPQDGRLRADADRQGRAGWSWKAPSRAVAGNWTMAARGESSGREVQIPFQIVAPPDSAQRDTSVTPESGAPGTTFTFTARNYNDQEYIDTWVTAPDGSVLRGTPIVQATRQGVATWQWVAPENVAGGRYEMVSRGQDTKISYRIPFTIVRDAPPPPRASVTPESGPPGTTFTFVAGGYEREELVGYWFTAPDGTVVRVDRELPAQRDGTITVTWTAPNNAQRGLWTFVARSSQSDEVHNDVTNVVRFRIE